MLSLLKIAGLSLWSSMKFHHFFSIFFITFWCKINDILAVMSGGAGWRVALSQLTSRLHFIFCHGIIVWWHFPSFMISTYDDTFAAFHFPSWYHTMISSFMISSYGDTFAAFHHISWYRCMITLLRRYFGEDCQLLKKFLRYNRLWMQHWRQYYVKGHSK